MNTNVIYFNAEYDCFSLLNQWSDELIKCVYKFFLSFELLLIIENDKYEKTVLFRPYAK